MTVLYIDYKKRDFGISDWAYHVKFHSAKSWPIKIGDDYDEESLIRSIKGFCRRAISAYDNCDWDKVQSCENSIQKIVEFYNGGEIGPEYDPKKDVHTCPECGFQTNVLKKDDSFDHHFGTEHIVYWGTDCCGAEVDYEEC